MNACAVLLSVGVVPLCAATTPLEFRRDLVELCSGRDAVGNDVFVVTHEGFRYHFTTAENLACFQGDPARYALQLDGACSRMGPLGTFGNPDIWLVHEGRVYVFRTEQCRQLFREDPHRFLHEPPSFPSADAEAIEAGRRLLSQAVAAAGGAERLGQINAWQVLVTDEPVRGRRRVKRTRTWAYSPGDKYRFDNREADWRGALVLNGDAGYVAGDYERPLYSAGRAELLRRLDHNLLTILKVSQAPGFRVALVGKAEVNGTSVQLVTVVFHDVPQTLGIDEATVSSVT